MEKVPFKKVLGKYDTLKAKVGLTEISKAHALIEKKDKKGLFEYANNLKDKTLQKAVLRLAKYL